MSAAAKKNRKFIFVVFNKSLWRHQFEFKLLLYSGSSICLSFLFLLPQILGLLHWKLSYKPIGIEWKRMAEDIALLLLLLLTYILAVVVVVFHLAGTFLSFRFCCYWNMPGISNAQCIPHPKTTEQEKTQNSNTNRSNVTPQFPNLRMMAATSNNYNTQ